MVERIVSMLMRRLHTFSVSSLPRTRWTVASPVIFLDSRSMNPATRRRERKKHHHCPLKAKVRQRNLAFVGIREVISLGILRVETFLMGDNK